jgi:predicted transcriptional regulator
LEEFGLETVPDFESAYIDSLITFNLRPQATTAPTGALVAPTEPAVSTSISFPPTVTTTTTAIFSDPGYRISKLEAANKSLTSVAPDALLRQAVTLMLANDYSQLPVMTNERDVKGVISWMSIGTRLGLGKSGDHVREFMDEYQEIRADASLFQAIPVIAQHQFVLVRGGDSRITGIITATDLSLQFHRLTEPFLLLGEIENHIRRVLEHKFTLDKLSEIGTEDEAGREISGVADLTFGDYIRLLENDERWKLVGIPIDRVVFCKKLDLVRSIRNDVMHFDPDGIPSTDLDILRDFANFLRRLQTVGAS